MEKIVIDTMNDVTQISW